MQDLFAEFDDRDSLYAGKYPKRPHPSGLGQCIQLPDGELYYAPEFFSPKIRDRLLQVLLANDRYPITAIDWADPDILWQNIPWRQDRIQMYGKQLLLPRFSSWHGDADNAYTYSGIRLQPNPWNNALSWLRDQLLRLTEVQFNSVLLNLYRNGEDHISWHRDNEPELGKNPVIASVNLGATRRFLLRRKDDPQQKIELPLMHGSLLVMSGALQQYWEHSVPKETRVRECRVNLTFRVIQSLR